MYFTSSAISLSAPKVCSTFPVNVSELIVQSYSMILGKPALHYAKKGNFFNSDIIADNAIDPYNFVQLLEELFFIPFYSILK